jgi:cytoskeletal protein CcmA (bactofilin family)
MIGQKTKALSAVKGPVTLIAAGTTIRGDICFEGNLDIEGTVIGAITPTTEGPALLRVIGTGVVQGHIHVPQAVIDGRVDGNIYSSERLELTASGVVTGDVFYHLIEMVAGCRVDGGLKHVSPDSLAFMDALVDEGPEDEPPGTAEGRTEEHLEEGAEAR